MRCPEKVRHATLADAEAACRVQRRQQNMGHGLRRLVAYQCRECGYFHVGHHAPRIKPQPQAKIPSTGELKRRLKNIEARWDKERKHRAYLVGLQVEADKRIAELHAEMQQAQRETLAFFGL